MVFHYPLHQQLEHLNNTHPLHYTKHNTRFVSRRKARFWSQMMNMKEQLLLSEYPAKWGREDLQLTFFKCMKWQVEETLDPNSCPYHYFCDSWYPGNFPQSVDIAVAVLATAWYLATIVLMVTDIVASEKASKIISKRYLLPSGPISLPLVLLALANGHRINSIFPLMSVGPAILQLVLVSALAFNDKDLKYAFFEASGILHASLYLDSVLLPYYTGYDALVSSAFSGECLSCVCREQALVVGGTLVHYRGWSVTMFSVVAALVLRIIGSFSEGKLVKWMESVLGCLGWVFIGFDSVYLIKFSPPEKSTLRVGVFGSILVLICLQAIKKMSAKIAELGRCRSKHVRRTEKGIRRTEKECDGLKLNSRRELSERELL